MDKYAADKNANSKQSDSYLLNSFHNCSLFLHMKEKLWREYNQI